MKPSAAVLELWQRALDLLTESELNDNYDIETLLQLQKQLRAAIHQSLTERQCAISLKSLTAYSQQIRVATKDKISAFLDDYPEGGRLLENLGFSLLAEASETTDQIPNMENTVRAF